MRKVFAIALNDLRIILKDRGVLLNLVVVPIGIALAVGVANGASLGGGAPGTPDIIVDVIDGDQSARSAEFLDDLRAANPNLLLCPLDNTADDSCELGGATLDETLATERLREQQSLALVILPAGFADQIAAGEPVSIIYRSNENAGAPSYILQALQTVTQRWSAELVTSSVGSDVIGDFLPTRSLPEQDVRAALLERAEAAWANEPIQINYVESVSAGEAGGAAGFSQSIPGIATMYVMFAVLPALSAFLQERKNWTFQRLVMMPVTRAQILGGKLLARFILGMVQYGIVFAFGYLLGVRYGNDPLALVLIMVSYVACITALTLTLLAFVRSEAQAAGLSLFLTLTLAPLGGAWWPLEIVPSWMQALGHLSPVAWAMDGYHSLIFYNGSLSTVLLPVGVLLAATVVLFAIGVARFRYG